MIKGLIKLNLDIEKRDSLLIKNAKIYNEEGFKDIFIVNGNLRKLRKN